MPSYQSAMNLKTLLFCKVKQLLIQISVILCIILDDLLAGLSPRSEIRYFNDVASAVLEFLENFVFLLLTSSSFS